MQVDDGGDDRQTKAEPAVLVVAAVKPLEHSFALGFGNARAGVEDVNAHAAFVVDGAQCHLTAGRGEFDRVAQQVGQCFKQQRAVPGQARQGGRCVQQQRDLAFFGQRQVKVIQFLQQWLRVELHKARAALVVFELGNAQQPAKTRHQGVGFSDHLIHLHGFGRPFRRLLLDAIQLRAQTGQRGAQVVGNVVAHAFDFVHQPLDAVEHGVDDGGEHVQFVTPIGQRQAVGQIPRDNGFGAGLNRPDALQGATS